MKLLSLTTASLLSLSLLSSFSYAEEEEEAPNSYGLVLGIASAEYKNSTQDGNGIVQAYLFYNYQVVEHFSVEVAYSAGLSSNWDCDEKRDNDWECTNDAPIFGLRANEMELNSIIVAVKGETPLSQRNSLYAKVGAQFYDYEFNRDGRFVEGDDGTGLFLEAGWQFQWDSGLGMNVGLRYQDLGELTLKSPNVGISYSF